MNNRTDKHAPEETANAITSVGGCADLCQGDSASAVDTLNIGLSKELAEAFYGRDQCLALVKMRDQAGKMTFSFYQEKVVKR